MLHFKDLFGCRGLSRFEGQEWRQEDQSQGSCGPSQGWRWLGSGRGQVCRTVRVVDESLVGWGRDRSPRDAQAFAFGDWMGCDSSFRTGNTGGEEVWGTGEEDVSSVIMCWVWGTHGTSRRQWEIKVWRTQRELAWMPTLGAGTQMRKAAMSKIESGGDCSKMGRSYLLWRWQLLTKAHVE